MFMRGHILWLLLVAGAASFGHAPMGCAQRSEEDVQRNTISSDDRSRTKGSGIELEERRSEEQPTPSLPEPPSKTPTDGVIGHRPPVPQRPGGSGASMSTLGDISSLTGADARTLRAMLQAQQAQCSTLQGEYRRAKASDSSGSDVDQMTREVARCEAMLTRIRQRMRAVGVSEN